MTSFIDINSDYYPEKLRKIKDPPEKLFFKGNINLLSENSIAIVGSRNLSEYGRKNEKKFVKDIALMDITVVSGMALGADKVAHEETLNVNGKTIAVMGSGFNKIFPKENIELFERIISENGLVITEYDDNVKPVSKNFPKRNRIISGISEAVVVIEANIISGSLITARLAYKQGKNVFAFPGRLDMKQGIGVNKLIQNGAKLVMSYEDVISELPCFSSRRKKIIIHNPQIKKEYRRIYNLLTVEPITLEEIALKTNNSVMCTAKLLSLMEIEDLIERKIGVGYIRKEQE